MKSRNDFLPHDEQGWNDYLLTYFAARAMAGILANPLYLQFLTATSPKQDHLEIYAIEAVNQAQALIEELNRTMQASYLTRLKKAQ